jgi:molybdate transport system substrate-binding protein
MARWVAAVALPLALALVSGAACAAEVQVLISAGFFGAYSELAPAFEQATGHRLVTTRGPSVGDSPEAIPTRLANGIRADVVILDDAAADDLGRRGFVQPQTKQVFARSQIGMVVRAGAPVPDITTVDAFRKVLLAAKSVGYSDSTSGTYLASTLFAKLGLAEEMAVKGRKVRGPPSGEPVAAVVARGELEIGFQQVSELMHVPGTTLVGPIPAELQPRFAYSGAMTTNVMQPEAARALIRFIALPASAAAIERAGLAPTASRP